MLTVSNVAKLQRLQFTTSLLLDNALTDMPSFSRSLQTDSVAIGAANTASLAASCVQPCSHVTVEYNETVEEINGQGLSSPVSVFEGQIMPVVVRVVAMVVCVLCRFLGFWGCACA